MFGPRRLALRVLFVASAATAAGCFALFPLDDYGPGNSNARDGGPADAAGSLSSDGAADAAVVDPNAKHVFITSVTTDGKVFGFLTTTPDTLCRALAGDAGLTGSYKAWISYEGHAPEDHWGWGDGGAPAVSHYVDLQNRTVANSWSDLFQNAHPDTAIEIDEHGNKVGIDLDAGQGSCSANITPVWSNVAPDAGVVDTGNDCDEYANDTAMLRGDVGIVTNEPVLWTNACQLPCNIQARLYCFEQ